MVLRALAPLVLTLASVASSLAPRPSSDAKLDGVLRARANAPQSVSRVILKTGDPERAVALVRNSGGTPIRRLSAGQVALVPDRSLKTLAASSLIESVSLDRRTHGTSERAAASSGARRVIGVPGFDGGGVGVAIVDSGVAAAHDDLGSTRVVHFADFVNGHTMPYDDYGHGTHVAGIIAGSGLDSGGAKRGVAPGAALVALKALDGTGAGHISDVIAAVDYAIANRATFNIRVINLSVAAGVYESYTTDPLTLAAKRAVDAGIVVVAAAGNLGRDFEGASRYGGIAAPGNAPWVLTVGASDDMGTTDREDDVVAAFSSRGPSALDRVTKPDVVASGVAVESTTEPSSTLFAAHTTARLWGTVPTVSEPYLALSGTSMAAPFVAGTAAIMFQANPSLTPNAVKAILQFTAESKPGYDHLTQGAGFLNPQGAVEMARAFGDPRAAATAFRSNRHAWSGHIIWGDWRVRGGVPSAAANAWSAGIEWGAPQTPEGGAIVWGGNCTASDPDCAQSPWMLECGSEERCGGRSAASVKQGASASAIESNVATDTLTTLENWTRAGR